MSERNFFAELKRRNVYKVAVAYAVVAWLLIQVASVVFPAFDAPAAAMKILIVLLVVGFPIALGFAWVFEITPEGIKRESEVEADKSIRRRTGRKIVALTVAVAAVAAALLAFQLLGKNATKPPQRIEAAIAIPEKSIAVLPFENLSSDKDNAYFADGIQDEILTKLASIADLKVISRTSTAKYKSKPEDLKTVSQQLGVATVLEGSVQKSGDKVRVNVQLIDARADSHLWARSYDGDAKDVFGVESQVSQQVADALRAKLSPAEAQVLVKAPTNDPEAYDSFLKGEYYLREARSALTAAAFDRADANYRQAISRAPDFALAVARLAESQLYRHWFVNPLTPEALQEVSVALDRALAVSPDLPEAHVALGLLHYWGHRNFEPGLAEFRRALELQPNNSEAHSYCGAIYGRQGQWLKSQAESARAQELDPRDAAIPANLGMFYVNLRQWNDAERAGQHALSMDPNNLLGTRALSYSAVNGRGDIEAARRAVALLPAGARLTSNAIGGAVSFLIDERTYLHVLRRDFAAAMAEWQGPTSDPVQRWRQLSARVAIHVLAGTAAEAKPESEEARALLEARLRERPDDAFAMTRLAWVLLALDRNADALRVAQQSAKLIPIEKDAVSGPSFAVGLAQIQARAGQPKEAIRTLRYLLSIPAGVVVSLQRLRLDPVWDPIRNDPEFQQLLAGKEQIGPNK
ncbi:MAG TPA: hypothetical protein VF751_07090 [Chthoniobacterales bacterium]